MCLDPPLRKDVTSLRTQQKQTKVSVQGEPPGVLRLRTVFTKYTCARLA